MPPDALAFDIAHYAFIIISLLMPLFVSPTLRQILIIIIIPPDFIITLILLLRHIH